MKKFDVPGRYRSSLISAVKEARNLKDPRKKDYTAAKLNFGPVVFYLARHFGFCYGVENAIEIAYKTINENPGKRIFFLSEMIHNPAVNNDLLSQGVKFIMDPSGKENIPWSEIRDNDIVLIPAFGTTIEIENILRDIGVEIEKYDTTCPFVEKVWNRAAELGDKDFTVIIHGKASHEETRATFSHSTQKSHSLIVRNLEETVLLGKIIAGETAPEEFYSLFEGKYSEGFDPKIDLNKIGVVNQTTMLASETEEISNHLKSIMIKKYGENDFTDHFADTRDTLCYATNDNQKATYGLLKSPADLAVVIGGYNSSNTTHIVELLEQKFPVFFISGESCINSKNDISHFNIHQKKIIKSNQFLRSKEIVNIAVTSGASCPDAVVDSVIKKIISLFNEPLPIEKVLSDFVK